MTVGQKIKEARVKRNRTVEEVAEFLNVTPATISKYEGDKIKNIPRDKLEMISQFLDVSLPYLLGLENSNDIGRLMLSVSEQLLIEQYRLLKAEDQKTIEILLARLVEVEQSHGSYVQLTL